MAKLLKATTARRKSLAVNKGDLLLDSIADRINESVAYGALETSMCVAAEYESDLVEALTSAGYTVTYPEYEAALAGAWSSVVEPVKVEGFWSKLFSWAKPDAPLPEQTDFTFYNSGYSHLNISWAEKGPEQLELPLE